MTDIVERLRRTGAERQRTTAHDNPDHYLHVVAKISNADGVLMAEAADEIEQLQRDIGSMLLEREEARAEAERLRAALETIGRMKVVPDDVMNRVTLMAALHIARAVLTATPAPKKEDE